MTRSPRRSRCWRPTRRGPRAPAPRRGCPSAWTASRSARWTRCCGGRSTARTRRRPHRDRTRSARASASRASPKAGMARAWRHPLRAAYRVLGSRYPRVILLLQFQLTYLVVLGGVGLLRVYQPMSPAQLSTITCVALGLVAIENVFAVGIAWHLVSPAVAWLKGRRDPATTVAAW